MVTGADVPFCAALLAWCAEVERQFPCLSGFLYLLRRGDRFSAHHVIVDQDPEMPPCGLPIHQAPRFDSGLFRIASATDDQATILRPLRRLFVRRSPQHVRIDDLEVIVVLELALD